MVIKIIILCIRIIDFYKINYNKTFSDFDDFDNSVDFASVETQLVEKILKKLIDQIYNASMEDW